MKNIRLIILFVFFVVLGFFLSTYLNTKEKKTPKPRYINKGNSCYDKSIEKYYNEEYKIDGKWKSVYYGKKWVVVDNVKLASNIAYVILKEHIGNKIKAFDIYNINNEIWAVYEANATSHPLLMFQRKDCKIIYIYKNENEK